MDEEYNAKYIPPNFENGINILGMSFRTIFLVEGVIFGAIVFLLSFILLSHGAGIAGTSKAIGYSLAFAALPLLVGLKGINDEPLTTFIANVIKFTRNKRIAYYNPRVKLEAISFYDEDRTGLGENIPREKVLELVNSAKAKYQNASDISPSDEFDPEAMVFEDDLDLEE